MSELLSGVQRQPDSKIKSIKSNSSILKPLVKKSKGLFSKLKDFERDEIGELRSSFGKFSPHLGLFVIFGFVLISNISAAYGGNEPVKSIVLATLDQQEIANFSKDVTGYLPANTKVKIDYNQLADVYLQDEYRDAPQKLETNKTAEVALKKEVIPPVARTQTINYTVEGGDTLSLLSKRYNLKMDTIKLANNITNTDKIKPGQQLKIPPKDLTTSQIAQAIKKQSGTRTVAVAQASDSTRTRRTNGSNGSGSVQYVERSYGQCVPWAREYSGKAVYGVARYIMPNTQSPSVGAVILTSESGYGHAAVVIGVNGNSVEIMERNYTSGWITKRTIPADSHVIRGYFN